jgi:hypothetical protein
MKVIPKTCHAQKLEIYIFITIIGLMPLLVDYYSAMASSIQ